MWAHGGFFTQGNKSEIGTIAPFMAKRGYVVLSIEYRLNPALPQGLEGYSASEHLPYDLALLAETIRDGAARHAGRRPLGAGQRRHPPARPRPHRHRRLQRRRHDVGGRRLQQR